MARKPVTLDVWLVVTDDDRIIGHYIDYYRVRKSWHIDPKKAAQKCADDYKAERGKLHWREGREPYATVVPGKLTYTPPPRPAWHSEKD